MAAENRQRRVKTLKLPRPKLLFGNALVFATPLPPYAHRTGSSEARKQSWKARPRPAAAGLRYGADTCVPKREDVFTVERVTESRRDVSAEGASSFLAWGNAPGFCRKKTMSA